MLATPRGWANPTLSWRCWRVGGWCRVLGSLCTSGLCNRQSCLVSITRPPGMYWVVHSL